MNHMDYPTDEPWQHEMNQLIFEILFKDRWQQCLWCWKWGVEVFRYGDGWNSDFILPDGIRSVTYHNSRTCYLCDTCSGLAEPPWYPNARRRCAQSLKHIMPQLLRGHDEVLAALSKFVIGNEPWQCRSYTVRVTPCCTLHCHIPCSF